MANSDEKNSLGNNLGIDFSDVTKEISKIEKKLDEFCTSLNKNKKEINSTLNEILKIEKELAKFSALIDDNKKELNSTSKEIRSLRKEQEELERGIKESGQAAEEQKNKMQSLNDEISEATENLGKLKAKEEEAKSEINASTAEFEKQEKKLEDNTKSTGLLHKALEKLGTSAKSLISKDGAKKLWELLIGSNEEMEQYQTSFEIMLGDAEKAKTLISDIQNFAAKTPLTMSDSVSIGSLLIDYGVEADEVIDKMTKLGDIAGGDADKMKSIASAYGQMLAEGKVTEDGLRQMTEAVIPLQNALAESIGVTCEEFSKMVSAGQIGIDDLDMAIEELTTGNGRFAGTMEKQSQTMQGMLSNLQENVSEFFRQMGEGAFGEVKDVLADLMAQLEEWEEDGTLKRWADKLGITVSNLIKLFKGAVEVAFEYGDTIVAVFAGRAVYNAVDKLTKKFKELVESGLKLSANAAMGKVTAGIEGFTASINPAALAVSGFAVVIGGLIAKFREYDQITEEYKQNIENIEKAAEDIVANAQAEISVISLKAERYEKLRTAAELTAAEEEELKNIAAELQETFGDEVEVVDKATGSYKDLTEAIEKYTEKKLAQARSQALYDEYKELIKEQNRLLEERKELVGDEIDEIILNGGVNFKMNSASPLKQFADSLYTADRNGKLLINDRALSDVGNRISEIEEQLKSSETAVATFGASADSTMNSLKQIGNFYVPPQLAAEWEAAGNTLNQLGTSAGNTASKNKELSDSYKETESAIEANKDAADKLASSIKNVNSAYLEQKENGKLSYDTIMSLVDAGYATCLQIDDETNSVKLNTEAYKELAQAKIEARMTDIRTDMAETTSEIESEYSEKFNSYSHSGHARYIADELNKEKDEAIAAATAEAAAELAALQDLYDNIGSYVTAERTTSTASSKKTEVDEVKEAADNLTKSLKSVNSAYLEQQENGKLSYDTAMSLIDAGYASCLETDEETNAIRLNTEAYEELARAKLNARMNNLKAGDITSEVEVELAALQDLYDNIDSYVKADNSKTTSETIDYSVGYEAYKAEADKKLALISEELAAKKELRDKTIAYLDEEIKKRKELNEDDDMQREIDRVAAQLEYAQLDDFSRAQLEKKLKSLKEEQGEILWQRDIQRQKDEANQAYESAAASASEMQEQINNSVETVKRIIDALKDGVTNINNVVNNNNTVNNSANISLANQYLTMAQITKAVRDALIGDVTILTR